MAEQRNSEMPGVPRHGGGQTRVDAQPAPAAPATNPEIAGHVAGVGETDQTRLGAHVTSVGLAATIGAIREEWRRRQAWQRAEVSLTLQVKSLCRRLAPGGDKDMADEIYSAAIGGGDHPQALVARVSIAPLIEARKGIEAHRRDSEKTLARLAGRLPVATFVEATRGVGLMSLAAIVGEAGDLGAYANPAKLWKRMGAAVIDGGRQRRVSGPDALRHGYSPARRSVLWNIGASIMRAGGPLKAVYDERKLLELAKCEAIAADPGLRAVYASGGKYSAKLHAHNRARRYVEKRFLRDLWRAWRRDGLAPAE